ncbi:MAG: acyloxyacyl hydrolase [Phycisphaerales bacterium]
MKSQSVRSAVLILGGLVGAAADALARTGDAESPLSSPLVAAPLVIDTAGAYAGARGLRDDPPAAGTAPSAATEPALKESETERAFGLSSGGWWITFGGGYANDFDGSQDFNGYVAFSTFWAKELEFSVELAAHYFAQEGEDTGGIDPAMVFRWHFWHAQNFDWTVFGEVGIGLLFSFDDVPDGGTSFNFTPRAGVGYTTRIGDDDTRLVIGVRYAHISNARIEGDDRNPGRDSVMVYAGVVFPF